MEPQLSLETITNPETPHPWGTCRPTMMIHNIQLESKKSFHLKWSETQECLKSRFSINWGFTTINDGPNRRRGKKIIQNEDVDPLWNMIDEKPMPSSLALAFILRRTIEFSSLPSDNRRSSFTSLGPDLQEDKGWDSEN